MAERVVVLLRPCVLVQPPARSPRAAAGYDWGVLVAWAGGALGAGGGGALPYDARSAPRATTTTTTPAPILGSTVQ